MKDMGSFQYNPDAMDKAISCAAAASGFMLTAGEELLKINNRFSGVINNPKIGADMDSVIGTLGLRGGDDSYYYHIIHLNSNLIDIKEGLESTVEFINRKDDLINSMTEGIYSYIEAKCPNYKDNSLDTLPISVFTSAVKSLDGDNKCNVELSPTLNHNQMSSDLLSLFWDAAIENKYPARNQFELGTDYKVSTIDGIEGVWTNSQDSGCGPTAVSVGMTYLGHSMTPYDVTHYYCNLDGGSDSPVVTKTADALGYPYYYSNDEEHGFNFRDSGDREGMQKFNETLDSGAVVLFTGQYKGTEHWYCALDRADITTSSGETKSAYVVSDSAGGVIRILDERDLTGQLSSSGNPPSNYVGDGHVSIAVYPKSEKDDITTVPEFTISEETLENTVEI